MGIRYIKYRIEENEHGKFNVIKDQKGKSSIILHTCPTREAAKKIKDTYEQPRAKRKRATNGSSNAKLSTGSS